MNDGLLQEFHGDPPGQPVQRGAEQKALPAAGRRELLDDLFDVGKKAHVEQAVGLVDHQNADVAEAEDSLFLEVHQPAGRADQDVGPLAENGLLALVADAAVKTADRESEMFVQRFGLALDLDGQLAGGGDDQGLARSCGTRPGAGGRKR